MDYITDAGRIRASGKDVARKIVDRGIEA